MKQANTTQSGYLSSTDWNTFNGKQATLGFTPINKAGDTSVGSLALASQSSFNFGTYTTSQETTLVGSLGSSDTGKTWYNSTTNLLKYWNGTSAVTVSSLGTAITSLNGLSGATQTFTNDTNVTLTSSGTTHTLGWSGTLPLSRGGTNAGLTAVNGGVVYSTSSAMAVSAAGTSGQILTSNGAAAPTWATLNDTTKVSKAGDTMTGALTFVSWTTGGRPSSLSTGATGFNSTLGLIETYNGSAWVSAPTGGVTSVTATAPLVSSGGTTPALSLPMATISQAGYLASADWTTFNGKQAALGYTPVNKAGDTLTGALVLAADPTANLQSATKQYVDSATSTMASSYLRIDGTSNLTGNWTASSTSAYKISGVHDPSAAQDVATKNYVDTRSLITSLNGLTGATQTFATGGGLTVTSSSTTHTFSTVGVPLAAATTTALSTQVTGDTQMRFLRDANGTQTWGSGSATGDVGLKRSVAGVLAVTDGSSGVGSLATLKLAAGVATAGGAPLKIAAGTLLTTAENGTIEYNGTNLYMTDGSGVRGILGPRITATASLTFASVGGGACSDLTMTLAGAASGDAVSIGLPSTPPSAIIITGFVSAANTITIRACNIAALTNATPPAGTYKAVVIR